MEYVGLIFYINKMVKRMDEIRDLGNLLVLYVESLYIREDCRRNGMARLMLDALKLAFGEQIIWLNMEPTSGSELNDEYDHFPVYSPSELGQLNINAAISERLGFVVDPDTWHRQAETLSADGSISTEVILVRKCAYYLPQIVRDLLSKDGDLVAVGRAMQKIAHQKSQEEEATAVDVFEAKKDGWIIAEWKETVISGENIGRSLVCYAARKEDSEIYKFGVSYRSPIHDGLDHDNQIEVYEYLDDATESEYFEQLMMLGMRVADLAEM